MLWALQSPLVPEHWFSKGWEEGITKQISENKYSFHSSNIIFPLKNKSAKLSVTSRWIFKYKASFKKKIKNKLFQYQYSKFFQYLNNWILPIPVLLLESFQCLFWKWWEHTVLITITLILPSLVNCIRTSDTLAGLPNWSHSCTTIDLGNLPSFSTVMVCKKNKCKCKTKFFIKSKNNL